MDPLYTTGLLESSTRRTLLALFTLAPPSSSSKSVQVVVVVQVVVLLSTVDLGLEWRQHGLYQVLVLEYLVLVLVTNKKK